MTVFDREKNVLFQGSSWGNKKVSSSAAAAAQQYFFTHQHGSSFSLRPQLGTAHLKIWLWQKYDRHLKLLPPVTYPSYPLCDNNLSRDKFLSLPASANLCQFLLTWISMAAELGRAQKVPKNWSCLHHYVAGLGKTWGNKSQTEDTSLKFHFDILFCLSKQELLVMCQFSCTLDQIKRLKKICM